MPRRDLDILEPFLQEPVTEYGLHFIFAVNKEELLYIRGFWQASHWLMSS